MRLLYVIDSLAPGGAETSLAEMAPGLVAAGVELHVVPLRARLDLAPRLERAGATVHVPHTHRGRIGNLRALIGVSRSIRPNLIHTTLYESDVAGRSAARLLGILTTSSIVNDSYSASHFSESNRARLEAARALDAATSRFATRFHAISTAIADSVAPRLAISREKVEVIPRGRDPKNLVFRPRELRVSTRLSLGVAPDLPVVLAVGRLEPQKGLQHLLRAIQTVGQRHPNVVLLLAGRDGRASEALHSIAAELPYDIRFLGHRADVPALLAAADVLSFSSEREGFGGVLIEAMAVGCPIVATPIPTTLEVLGTGTERVGVMTATHEPGEFGRALSDVLDLADGDNPLVGLGRARFDRLFSIGQVTRRMASFFTDAADM